MKVKVSDFKVKKLIPKIPDRFKHLAPTVLQRERCTFTLDGCSNAVANGIRRTILCELKVLYLKSDYEEITTDDPFIIPEMIQKRLRMIPLLQSVPQDTKFSLEVTNNTTNVMDVKTKLFGKNYFDETITILALQPGKSVKITARVASEYGYVPDYGMCAVAFNATSICKDMKPYNAYEENIIHALQSEDSDKPVSDTKIGAPRVSSHMADPRVWEISFNTNGTLTSKEIVKRACAGIIERLKSVISLLYTMANNDKQYVLTVNGDSDTIGNLLVKTIDELYPDVEAATYSTSPIERLFTIRIIYDEDINTLYKNVVEHLIAIYESISNQL